MTLGESIRGLIELGRFIEMGEIVAIPMEVKEHAMKEILVIIQELEVPELLGDSYVHV